MANESSTLFVLRNNLHVKWQIISKEHTQLKSRPYIWPPYTKPRRSAAVSAVNLTLFLSKVLSALCLCLRMTSLLTNQNRRYLFPLSRIKNVHAMKFCLIEDLSTVSELSRINWLEYKTKSLVQAALTPSGQKTEWAYSTPPDSHGRHNLRTRHRSGLPSPWVRWLRSAEVRRPSGASLGPWSATRSPTCVHPTVSASAGSPASPRWTTHAVYSNHSLILIICPNATAHHGADYKITCVWKSACLSSLLRPQFLFASDEILHSGSGPENKTVCLGFKSDDPFPYVAPIFTPIMHFQGEGSNTTVRKPEDL